MSWSQATFWMEAIAYENELWTSQNVSGSQENSEEGYDLNSFVRTLPKTRVKKWA
jgi:hypothetical protein